MIAKRIRLLLVEDDENDELLLLRRLQQSGYETAHRRVEDAAGLQAALQTGGPWDLVISDHNLPRFSSREALGVLQAEGIDLPFLILSGAISEAEAVEAMTAGAHDYIMKQDLARLIPAIARELREAELRRRARRSEDRLRGLLDRQLKIDRMAVELGNGADLQRIYESIHEHACDALGANRFAIWLYDRRAARLQAAFLAGGERIPPQEIAAASFLEIQAPGAALHTAALQRGEPCIAQGSAAAEAGQALRAALERAGLAGSPAERLLLEPMKTGGAVTGLIEIHLPDNPGPAPADDLLDKLAAFAAVGIENHRLLADLHQSNRALARRVKARTLKLREAVGRLQQAARAKDEFLANMSHELRTPLNSVLGLSEALQEEVYGPLNHKQRQALKTVEQSGRHLLALINDILDLSKIEAGKAAPQIERADLDEICTASVRMLGEAARQKGLRLTCAKAPAPLNLQTDARRLKQVLVNLLANAVKFTPAGGEVRLELRPEHPSPDHISLIVADTGIGIPEDKRELLFQPFVQLDASIARRHEGTGLGLALAARIAKLLGGSISLESEEGQGSRFCVQLPLAGPATFAANSSETAANPPATGAPPPSFDAEPQEHPRAARRILLVDDNEQGLAMIRDYLERAGYRVCAVSSGAEALEQASAAPFDAILLDVQMPEMDGLEVMRRLRAGGLETPVLVLTALAMPGDRERCRSAGADDYLARPVRLRELIGRIEALLARRRSPQSVS